MNQFAMIPISYYTYIVSSKVRSPKDNPSCSGFRKRMEAWDYQKLSFSTSITFMSMPYILLSLQAIKNSYSDVENLSYSNILGISFSSSQRIC
jgi:hypothetical protein